MNTELLQLIKTVIQKELDPDSNVVNNSFVLEPYMVSTVLKGDGNPTEVSTRYQLDIFYDKKGECINKAKALITLLSSYLVDDFTFTWESTARKWRATTTIEIL